MQPATRYNITEPYGTTPLPVNRGKIRIQYNPGDDVWDVAQQPKSQQIASYEGLKVPDAVNGATVLDVNPHFCIYAVKKGLIRILHRHSTLRSLFRGHAGQTVSDIQIFMDGDVLASVGYDTNTGTSTLIIWRVFERTPEIMSEILLEITTMAYKISRVIWHPFNPNQFWMIHTSSSSSSSSSHEGDDTKIASLVDTTRISTLQHATEHHAVCMFHQTDVVMDGVTCLNATSASSLIDLDWSEKDVRHVLTCHENGDIRLWDLRQTEINGATMLPACLCILRGGGEALSRCKFLPHECSHDDSTHTDITNNNNTLTSCFLTAANNNSQVTLWSPFTESCRTHPPTKVQVFGLDPSYTAEDSSYVLDICYGPSPPEGPPPSMFVLMADQTAGKLFAWHVQSEWASNKTVVALVGCNFVVPFVTSFPMYSWSCQVQPAADISEDDMGDDNATGGGLVFDMKLFSYQSTVIQSLILTSFMCLPPGQPWNVSTPGVTVEELEQDAGAGVPAEKVPSEMALSDEFGDYEVDEEEDDGEDDADYSEPPEASALPVPEGLDSPGAEVSAPGGSGGGVFANWLGALAVKASGPAPVPPPPPPVVSATQSTASNNSTMLTPADLFPNHPSIIGTTSNDGSRASGRTQEPQSIQNARNDSGGEKKVKAKSESRSRTPAGKSTKSRNNSPPPNNVSILQKEAPVVSAATVAVGNGDLAGLFRQQQDFITKEIQNAVQKEMKTTLVPLIDQKVRESVQQAVDPVLASITTIGKQGIQVDHNQLVSAITKEVEAPLRAVFAENMKNVLIPAFESVSGQMFAQISRSLEKGLAQKSAAADADSSKLTEISQQLAEMTSMVNKLSSEVSFLRSNIQEQNATRGRSESLASSVGIPTAAEQQRLLEQEVTNLLGQRQYEAAFTKALSASTVEMALFVCRNANLSDVLGGHSPALSQPILLCLMHQLGTSVVQATDDQNLQTELAWLQEVSLSLNPIDESMRKHLPGVLQQLVAGVNEKMGRTDPQARRPLQRLLQVLRGIQVQ